LELLFLNADIAVLLKVKESKDKAMSTLNSYRLAVSQDLMHDSNPDSQQATETGPLLFVSLLEFVSEIYQVCCTLFV
jgi:nuclear pore complex protein Nup205